MNVIAVGEALHVMYQEHKRKQQEADVVKQQVTKVIQKMKDTDQPQPDEADFDAPPSHCKRYVYYDANG